ncbi:heme biosynthesis HemY N-terminal domain-containing protein [Roseospira goensis]|uniref:HemY protein n=1 Tax=Roseospira goensis TaxID=391922 RepID=A0A7W6WLJ3_9PROT|nr:heme biosynthesis HemY N-terminal domain-containing protein [Roseospira goensis]MBB4286904.1 HemY protein [Roseospira goensis]
MFQLILLIVLGVLVVAGGLWLASNPGSLSVAWLGWQIDTNMIFGLIGLVVLFVVFWIVLRLLGMLAGTLGLRGVKTAGNLERAARGVGEGYAALRAGRGAEAQVEAARARAAFPSTEKSPGALLEADGLALAGKTDAARDLYTALLANPDTEAGALRGLLDLAVKAGDDAAIKEWSERALFKVDSPVWAARPALDLAFRTGQVDGVERPLQVLEQSGEADVAEVRRLRANAFLHRARAAKDAGKLGDAVTLCRQALDLDPDAPEVVDALARILAGAGKAGKAEQLVQDTWKRAPDAVLARTWRDLAGTKDAMALANRMQTLAGLNPEHPESRLAAAEAAIEAKMWGQARTQLAPLAAADQPGVRACLLMARVEEGESGDSGKVMDWMRRAVAAAGGLGEYSPARAAADRPDADAA